MRGISAVVLLILCSSGLLQFGSGDTNQQDTNVLRSLLSSWQKAPPTWGKSNDPCGTPWEGVSCTGSRVSSLTLSTMSIKGTLSSDIGQLTELTNLDLSYNSDLGGTLSSSVGNLKKLTTLILAYCSFSGSIPDELGNLTNLSYLALNSNQFSGAIPASLGLLSNLYWLDLAENMLTGSLPISSSTSPGLDQLYGTKHFHFNKNQLSGQIPEKLFSSQMTLMHILFDGNQFSGPIPASVGLVTTLEVLRLDRNSLNGTVPSSIGNLSILIELNLANNKLTGPLPNISRLTKLNLLDFSNNTFTASEFPSWFSALTSLSAIVIENGGLAGTVPKELFDLPQLQQVIMPNNRFNGTLDLSNISTSNQIQLINFQSNSIVDVIQTSRYTNTLILVDNPVCEKNSNNDYCRLQQTETTGYSTTANCVSTICPLGQSHNPGNCLCAVPYQGQMIFRAPSFMDVTNSTRFKALETSLWTNLSLSSGSVDISNVFFNSTDKYIQLLLALFPSDGIYFNRSEILRLGYALSRQTYKPPNEFGPYVFEAFDYFVGSGGKSSWSTGAIAGIVVVGVVLLVGLVTIGIYALRQKRRAKEAIVQANPFASWGAGSNDVGSAPQLKGARYFRFDEIKKCTNNFSESNEIGSGGYGKVYRATISTGQMVAIKRAQQGSMQGGLEFKTEIELLSRVHHKNLVDLVGFCFEQGEQMLVYEFVPNGTLRENLIGRGGRQLDWKRRLRITLGSARGLAYLHELANPPIIHRDVKTTNILLDEYLNAKVADFGLSKLVSEGEKSHVSTQVKGTLGYLDPEYYMTQQLSEKSDVYSFGVVMLELITSRLPIEKGKYIVPAIREAIDRHDDEFYGLGDFIDPVIRNASSLVGFRRFVDLALRCVEDSAAKRPTMNQVVKEIELLLQSDGVNTHSNPNSASSSATDFGNTQKNPRHPYQDQLSRRHDSSGSAFDYSGGFVYSANIEPK